ncbi:MAG: hypothetical protein K0R73_320 [Candidatus Midichloriaceae bacterium]|jgi:hypothetical protein|nr:hypothetical protein [Candidatus Midichloriaceae bacterium]
MFAYDMIVPAPIGKFHAALLSQFILRFGIIPKIELFYDARPFQEKKSEIFDVIPPSQML